MNQPDPAEIEKIQARAEAATPGEWHIDTRQDRQLIIRTTDADVCQVFTDDLNSNPAEDAEFIANAKSDISTLLAALATAEERVKKAEAERDEAYSERDDDVRAAEAAADYARRKGAGYAHDFNARCVEAAELARKLRAAEEVIEAAERWGRAPSSDATYRTADELIAALANYHKATGPQAENEEAT